jgi:inorganic pyrophosphatase
MTGVGPPRRRGGPVAPGDGAPEVPSRDRPGSARTATPEVIEVIIEIPARTRNKYEFDEVTGFLRLDRQLPAALVYPADYGFVPGTLAEDGDPVDVLVLIDEPAVPGSVLMVAPLGLLRVRDEKGPDPKVIAVLAEQAHRERLAELSDLSERALAELEHFFVVYKDLEAGRWAETDGFGTRAEALEEIRAGRTRFSARARRSSPSRPWR